MNKKLIIVFIVFIFLGCSQKTIYHQVEGDILYFNHNKTKKITKKNKEEELKKVDEYANKIFNELYNKIKIQKKDEYIKNLLNIYTNKLREK